MLGLRRHIPVWLTAMLLAVPAAGFAEHLSVGFEGGYAPNILTQRDLFESLSLANQRIERRRSDVRNIYGNTVQITDVDATGSELNSIPFGVNVRYTYRKLFFKLGFIRHEILADKKSYILNTTGGVDSSLSDGRNLYADLDKNADADLTNDFSYAVGLAKTNGQDWRYTSYVSGNVFEIPFTFGVVLSGKEFYKYYIGAGLVFFQSNTTRVISVEGVNGDGSTFDLSGPNTGTDIDRFNGTAVGFHFLTGAEFRLTERFGLYAELAYNFGAAVPLEDAVQTGADTLDSLFQSNKPEDPGGTEVAGSPTKPARPRMSGLNFVSLRLAVGFNYYINIQRGPNK